LEADDLILAASAPSKALKKKRKRTNIQNVKKRRKEEK
jgi:hypothetical protein